MVGWVLATLGAVTLASQAVGLVRDQVTDRPARLAAELPLTTTTSAPPTTFVDPPSASVTTTAAEDPTTTTTTATTTTTVSVGTSSTTTTTPAPPVTSPASEDRIIHMIGGSVTARCEGEKASWVSYVPNSGFDADIENQGPEKLEIEFESEDHTSKLTAECRDGVLDSRVEEHHDD